MKDRKRNIDVKNRHLDSMGEGKVETICKNGIETYILHM